MMAGYTPGPWWLIDENEVWADGEEFGAFCVAQANNETHGEKTWPAAVATARLISAAPELLEACRALLKVVARSEPGLSAITQTQAAIAKATT